MQKNNIMLKKKIIKKIKFVFSNNRFLLEKEDCLTYSSLFT